MAPVWKLGLLLLSLGAHGPLVHALRPGLTLDGSKANKTEMHQVVNVRQIPAVQQLGQEPGKGKGPQCILDSCCKAWCKPDQWLQQCMWEACEMCDFCFPGITHNA